MHNFFLTDIPAQLAKISQGLYFQAKFKMCTSIKWRGLRKFDRSVFTQLNPKVGKKMHRLLWQLLKIALKLFNDD